MQLEVAGRGQYALGGEQDVYAWADGFECDEKCPGYLLGRRHVQLAARQDGDDDDDRAKNDQRRRGRGNEP